MPPPSRRRSTTRSGRADEGGAADGNDHILPSAGSGPQGGTAGGGRGAGGRRRPGPDKPACILRGRGRRARTPLRRAAHFGQAGRRAVAHSCPSPRRSWGSSWAAASCAMLAVTDVGLCRRPGGKAGRAGRGALRPCRPDRWRSRPAGRWSAREEQRQHEKNLRQGKRKKPAAPQPPAPAGAGQTRGEADIQARRAPSRPAERPPAAGRRAPVNGSPALPVRRARKPAAVRQTKAAANGDLRCPPSGGRSLRMEVALFE